MICQQSWRTVRMFTIVAQPQNLCAEACLKHQDKGSHHFIRQSLVLDSERCKQACALHRPMCRTIPPHKHACDAFAQSASVASGSAGQLVLGVRAGPLADSPTPVCSLVISESWFSTAPCSTHVSPWLLTCLAPAEPPCFSFLEGVFSLGISQVAEHCKNSKKQEVAA